MSEIIKIKLTDKTYPKLLRHIPDPPRVLYCRGNIKLLHTTCFGVVGARSITPYGKDATLQITRELAQHFTIVSGLALGVDAVAHQATLDVSGRTIAVLGSGVDDEVIYPATHLPLARQILSSNGLVISEYKPGTIARDYMFPARNRIVSGLSLGVLVVEANQKSGALITARLAAEQNRDVFAVPGSIFSPRSAGPNQLIQKGAKPVLAAADILQEYGAQLKLPSLESESVSTKNPLERAILAILEGNGPTILDEIIRKVDSDTPTVIAALSMLEINGRVQQITTGTYRKCN